METTRNGDEEKTVLMPHGFKAAFDFVCRYYQCSEAEIEEMRARVRADPENAAATYFRLQKEIQGITSGDI